MNLLPSDPFYWLIMADQAEDNPSTILPDAFRTKIYNLYDQSQPQSGNVFADRLSPDNENICSAVGDLCLYHNSICPDIFSDFSGDGYPGEGAAESFGEANGGYLEDGVYETEEDYV